MIYDHDANDDNGGGDDDDNGHQHSQTASLAKAEPAAPASNPSPQNLQRSRKDS